MKNESLIQVIEVDELQLLFRYDYHITEKLVVKQPTLQQVIEYGERNYYSMVNTICSIPSDMKSQLDDLGIDYEELGDFELFIMLTRELTREQTSILFGDLDFSELEPMMNSDTEEVVLVKNGEIVIDRLLYQKMIQYVRCMHGIVPKVEKSANKYTKKILIEEERNKLKRSAGKPYKSQLLPIIISLINTEEFKYNSSNIKKIGIYELTLSIQQIQKKKAAIALLQGSYSGMVDTSKISKESFSWIYSSN